MEYIVTADNNGTLSYDTVYISIEALPVVSFGADLTSGCSPMTVTFTNISSGGSPLVDCRWDFGNGGSLTSCNYFTITYLDGLYDVTLTVTTDNGCTNSETYIDYVYVEENPNVAMMVDAPICPPWIVELNGAGSGVFEFLWLIDSSLISRFGPHLYEFQDAGTYNIQVLGMSPLGCSDTTGQVIVLKDCKPLDSLSPQSITLSPNPTSSEMAILIEENYENEPYTILNISGKVVMEGILEDPLKPLLFLN
ncbi:MAG: hypothetical protein HRT57_04915 [Crocinitomicaceae bacterium]|nr:hypothetical protein [Crocinitomicaceae bacterium]